MSSLAEKREQYKTVANEQVSKGRDEYKNILAAEMDNRNKYRDMISQRKEKEKAVLELLTQEKIDLAALETAIKQA